MELSNRKNLLNLQELNTACSEGNESAIRELLGSRTPIATSPTLKITQDKEAHLPTHTACQRQRSGKIVEMLLTSGNFSIVDQTANRDTALHVACINKNLEAVKALLSFSEPRSIQACLNQNKDGNTPFHLAALYCSSDITASLLQLKTIVNTHTYITKKNKRGQTCLGIAIEGKDWLTAQLLLIHSNGNPASQFSDFLSLVPEYRLMADFNLQALDCDPFDVFVLGDQESGKSTLISTLLQASQPAGFTKYASKIVSSFNSSHPTSKTCSISIVPSTVEYRRHKGSHDHKCPVTFHDVNNYHGYSHEAIFKCASDPLEALYIISVDMTTKDIEGSILYWLHFLYRQLTEYTCIMQSPARHSKKKLKILVVGTFYDSVSCSHSNLVSINDLLVRGRIGEELASHFSWCGDLCVNTKKISSCSAVLSKIHDHCGHHPSGCFDPETQSFLAQSHILANLLLKEYPKNSIITFNDITGLIQTTESTLCALLPREDPSTIEKLCEKLKYFNSFKVLNLNRLGRKIGYIAFDYKYLLLSIEQSFADLSSRSQHGIVAKQDIKEVFEYNHRFIIRFLEHFNLCEKVNGRDLEIMRRSIRTSMRSLGSKASQRSTHEVPVTDSKSYVCHRRSKSESDSYMDLAKRIMVELNRSVPTGSSTQLSKTPTGSSRQSSKKQARPRKKEVRLYFVPTLISRVQFREVWSGNDEYGYGVAWSLVPQEGDTQFFSHRFVTVILFRLLFSFAPPPTTIPKFPLDRQCELWDKGIVWCDPHGARICVAVSDHNKITLSMQCLKGSEIACLSIRNEIMSDIKQKLEEIHPGFNPREIFIPLEGNKFPVFDPLKSNIAFDKEEIRKAIVEGHTVLCTKAKQHKHVNSLLHFEPLCFLGQQLLQELIDAKNSDRQISDDFCMTFAKNLSCNWIFVAKHWETILQTYYIDSLTDGTTIKRSPHDTAMEMLTHLRDIDHTVSNKRLDTYGGLKSSLFEISIFS